MRAQLTTLHRRKNSHTSLTGGSLRILHGKAAGNISGKRLVPSHRLEPKHIFQDFDGDVGPGKVPGAVHHVPAGHVPGKGEGHFFVLEEGPEIHELQEPARFHKQPVVEVPAEQKTCGFQSQVVNFGHVFCQQRRLDFEFAA